jgi:hypothetical protein
MLSLAQDTVLYDGMINEQWIEVLFWHLHGQTEEIRESPQTG